MNSEDLHTRVTEIIKDVVPEKDVSSLDASARYRDVLGMDSMDFLEVVERLYDETGVEIPEADYDDVQTVDDLTRYLSSHGAG